MNIFSLNSWKHISSYLHVCDEMDLQVIGQANPYEIQVFSIHFKTSIRTNHQIKIGTIQTSLTNRLELLQQNRKLESNANIMNHELDRNVRYWNSKRLSNIYLPRNSQQQLATVSNYYSQKSIQRTFKYLANSVHAFFG